MKRTLYSEDRLFDYTIIFRRISLKHILDVYGATQTRLIVPEKQPGDLRKKDPLRLLFSGFDKGSGPKERRFNGKDKKLVDL